jgi:hypothetical protein
MNRLKLAKIGVLPAFLYTRIGVTDYPTIKTQRK